MSHCRILIAVVLSGCTPWLRIAFAARVATTDHVALAAARQGDASEDDAAAAARSVAVHEAAVAAKVVEASSTAAGSGTLSVAIVKARQLARTDLLGMGSPDAYVNVKVGQSAAATHAIANNEWPEWNWHQDFKVGPMDETVKLSVLDHDEGPGFWFSGDDHLGDVNLAFRHLEAGKSKIFDESLVPFGSLRVGLKWTPN